ncbi:MAG: hypothetical protein K8F54_04180 [Altibacter sp.]|uniref:hypothetical protein n=1 Tax=Altibacter sp. TaxID=2024823 RepID=UPI001E05668C|nr:hypothetical protein [Altibacter sp.]MBZ0326778.1 hypothetical protein [Altibacter sp.]
MAKIISVELMSVPDVIHVGDELSEIKVTTKIQFHKMDIQLGMEYCLNLFVYDVHGKTDTPIIIPNWDESKLIPISSDRRDDFMGREVVKLVAGVPEIVLETPIALKLGKLSKKNGSYFSRKLEVFATIAPAVGRASKWSGPFEATLVY